VTAKARYQGFEDFQNKASQVGRGNVGSMMYPISYEESCDCDSAEIHEMERGLLGIDPPTRPERQECETRFSRLEMIDGVLKETDVRMIKQSDLMKCPHYILMASHYREDGSCKCDDPDERAMMIREWGYSPKDFEGSMRNRT
jgi:hypothetical protein